MAQVAATVVRSAQQTWVPWHGTVGQVAPPSPSLPLLDPLPPPELPPPLPPPEPPPPELPPDELLVLASEPEPAPGLLLLLLEQPAHVHTHATTVATVREIAVREDMVASGWEARTVPGSGSACYCPAVPPSATVPAFFFASAVTAGSESSALTAESLLRS